MTAYIRNTGNISLDKNIYAVIQNRKLMVSLGEICDVLDFAITTQPQAGTASGWFIHENQSFFLNTSENIATIQNRPLSFDPADISIESQDILVASTLIEKWFGIEVNMDLSKLALYISSPFPLPIEAKIQRQRRRQYGENIYTTSKLPLKKEPYRLASLPYVDVAATSTITKATSNADTQFTTDWSAVSAGDLFGMTSRTFASGIFTNNNKTEAVRTLRQTFSREDPDGKHIGPLTIKTIAVGDVLSGTLPLIGGNAQEQGIYLSNRTKGDNTTTRDLIDVTGDSQPNWDVELYRNNSLIGIQNIDENGRYNFADVFLFEGENALRLVFYGPQGEVHEENRTVVANASGLDAGKYAWKFSATRTNQTTYTANKVKRLNDGDPRITAQYEYSFGTLGSINAGFVHRTLSDDTEKDTKDYVQAGLTSSYKKALLSSNVAVDLDGEYAIDVLTRRSLGKHQGGLRVGHASKKFIKGNSLSGFAPQLGMDLFLHGPLKDGLFGLSRPVYSVRANHTQSNGNGVQQLTVSSNGRFGNIGLSSGMRYNSADTSAGPSILDKTISFSSATGIWNRGRWRIASEYNMTKLDVESYQASYSRPWASNIDTAANIRHRVADDTTEIELSANLRTEHFSIAPRLFADTNENRTIGVNMRFSLAENPYTGEYEVHNRALTSSGSVAARTFLDSNGDGLYSVGEELLPDIEVVSRQSSKRGATDKDGTVFLSHITQGLKTDIEANSFPDPYFITMAPGQSIYPRPGITTKFDFPIVISGEVDGQAEYQDINGNTRAARKASIKLISPEGTVENTSFVAYDGYYSISAVRPGVYYLTADADKASASGYVLPRLLEFTPDGSTFFGEGISMKPGYNIPFTFRSINAPPVGKRGSRVITQNDIAARDITVNLGTFNSRLAMTFAWYKFKAFARPWNKTLSPAIPLSDIQANPKTGRMELSLLSKTPLSLQEAATACEGIQDKGLDCSISVITRYRNITDPILPMESKPLPQKDTTASISSAKKI